MLVYSGQSINNYKLFIIVAVIITFISINITMESRNLGIYFSLLVYLFV